MRYVILRDDDTNALTPVEALERLYRPFLDRGLPVNLSVIPDVSLNAAQADGRPEGFLWKNGNHPDTRSVPITESQRLVSYLRENPGYHVVQHGLHHDFLEFDRCPPAEIPLRLERGTGLLKRAGFPPPTTFVAPYDRLSRASLKAVAARFRVLSTGWFELERLPCAWWPLYLLKKLRRAPHWRVGHTLLLSHPGCLLSCQRPRDTMLESIQNCISRNGLCVLVTHWWEYFREGEPDADFIDVLHQTAEYLAARPDVKVISFTDLHRLG